MTAGGRRRPFPALARAALLVAAAGCQGGSMTGVEADLAEPFGIRVGEEVTLDDGGITVRFAGVAEDSRCPVDAVCVWEGNARLVMDAVVAGREHRFALNTASSPAAGPGRVVVDGYAVELVRLDPVPFVGRSIPLSSYRAVLRVDLDPTLTAAAAAAL